MNDLHESNTIYKNLYDGFFEYRKVEPITKQLSDEEFYEKMNHNKYITIFTKVSDQYNSEEYEYLHLKPITIILLSENSGTLSKQSGLSTLIDKAEKLHKNAEIIIILDRDDTKISQFNETFAKRMVTVYPFVKFAIVFPRCKQASDHRIMSPQEIDELINRLRITSVNMLNKITKNDTMAIWCGAKKDDVLEIKRISLSTMIAYDYRLVKK